MQCFELVVLVAQDVRHRFDQCSQERLQAQQVVYLEPLQPFEKNHYVAVGHFHGLVHFGEGPDLVQIRRRRIFHARIMLGYHAQDFVLALQRIDQRQ